MGARDGRPRRDCLAAKKRMRAVMRSFQLAWRTQTSRYSLICLIDVNCSSVRWLELVYPSSASVSGPIGNRSASSATDLPSSRVWPRSEQQTRWPLFFWHSTSSAYSCFLPISANLEVCLFSHTLNIFKFWSSLHAHNQPNRRLACSRQGALRAIVVHGPQ